MSPTSQSLAEMVSATLADPVDFPPFSRVAVEDDRLAIAITAEAAGWPMLVPAILSAISDLPLVAVDIVVANDATSDDFESLQQWATEYGGGGSDSDPRPGEKRLPVRLERHRGDDRTSMAYLAADQTDHPIYIARALADADLVLPVVVQGSATTNPGEAGLFPGFVDHEAIVRSQENDDTPPRPSVEWSLGVQLRMVVVVDEAHDLVAMRAEAIPPDWH